MSDLDKSHDGGVTQSRREVSTAKRSKAPRTRLFDSQDVEAAVLSAMRSLARVDQSRQALKRKLTLKGFSADTVQAALDTLERQRLLDDERALTALRERSLAKAHGPKRILGEMRYKGFAATAAKETLASVVVEQDPDYWTQQALLALQRRFKDKPIDDPKTEQQALRFLAGRGFAFKDCREAIHRYRHPTSANE